ncbi:hypothetical protein Ancab_002068 [Ancistrocladus abbreviatus]
MGSRALILLRGGAPNILAITTRSSFSKSFIQRRRGRDFSVQSTLEPSDVARLAETARISLTRQEVEKFAPTIQKVVEWFGQLQSVDLDSFEPAIHADTEGDNLRKDEPETFGNREAIIAAIPIYEEPYIKVPKVLNKE